MWIKPTTVSLLKSRKETWERDVALCDFEEQFLGGECEAFVEQEMQ